RICAPPRETGIPVERRQRILWEARRFRCQKRAWPWGVGTTEGGKQTRVEYPPARHGSSTPFVLGDYFFFFFAFFFAAMLAHLQSRLGSCCGYEHSELAPAFRTQKSIRAGDRARKNSPSCASTVSH